MSTAGDASQREYAATCNMLDKTTPMQEHRTGTQRKTPSSQLRLQDSISPMMLDLKTEPCCLYLHATKESLLLLLCFSTDLSIWGAQQMTCTGCSC